jgi:hypothetical protein
MNFFRRRKILKSLNFLEAIPVRVCDHKEEEDGKVSIVVPKFRNPKFNEWFLGKRPKNFIVKLDKTGSAVWSLIDGNRMVGEICEELEKQNIEEAVVRVTKFMTLLYEQRYITFRELQEDK